VSRGEQPEPLSEWLAAGFARAEAKLWRRWRFNLGEARAWKAAGVPDGLRAAQWSTAGVTAETIGDWQAAGIEATEAVAWHEFGVGLDGARRYKQQGLTPARAFEQRQTPQVLAGHGPAGSTAGTQLRRFAAAGVPAQVMNGYLLRQWWDDDALAWARQHIEAADAKLWLALGVRPAEAGRLTRQGQTAVEAVHDWWQAGIPLGEVAEWLGAGLTAEEAAVQRAKGITAEQAAALRALRDDSD
jgi:hypothetical protein